MDRYRLERYPCARTPTSSLYLGTDLTTGERVAVKVVDGSTPSGRRRMQRTLHGIQLVLRVGRHTGIVGIRGAYEVDQKAYVVMDCMAGGSLLDYVTRRGPLGEAAAAAVMRRLLVAVAHLHSFSVMHRDLKTENVLIQLPRDYREPPENVCICDFGFATSNIPNNECVGSPQYSAPEVAMVGIRQCKLTKCDYSYDEKCDVWSLGVVAYAILSGALPFDGSTPTEVFTNVLRHNIPFPRSAWQNVSEAAKDFVLFLMTPEPSKRPSALQSLEHPWLV
ncbi:putative protein kinase [Trypanosoma cruzi]|uniref:Protein kinase, putative n=3 Tax=Trypanosoma cruzi TaxID=5693 RepID=Q4DPL7_TRYCC|nr:protein kinase, putative [Trypanosoma cruzi]EAN94462.1 protein kinase, putative [Trypanosoma cruzi]PWU89818.1 putative protein kinase [Trypanosoma cruzi]|eukprot:XP_816313.1 protein kinase [Trypanosoma cruzi strain CL Brener]